MKQDEIRQQMRDIAIAIAKTEDCNEKEQLIQKNNKLKILLNETVKIDTIEYFNTMSPFDGNVDKIPSIPVWNEVDYNQYIIPNLIRCGAIPKKDLIVGKTYIGNCRNAGEAIWNGEKFTYKRYKFGTVYDEDINHFEDDDGSDLFVPIKLKDMTK